MNTLESLGLGLGSLEPPEQAFKRRAQRRKQLSGDLDTQPITEEPEEPKIPSVTEIMIDIAGAQKVLHGLPKHLRRAVRLKATYDHGMDELCGNMGCTRAELNAEIRKAVWDATHKVCAACKNVFEIKITQKNKKYCSPICRLRPARVKQVIAICSNPDCGKEYLKNRSDKRYCCKKCRVRNKTIRKAPVDSQYICEECGDEFAGCQQKGPKRKRFCNRSCREKNWHKKHPGKKRQYRKKKLKDVVFVV